MCRVLDDVCRGQLPQCPVGTPAASVVLVVGGDHLPGLRQMWGSGSWLELLAIEPGGWLALRGQRVGRCGSGCVAACRAGLGGLCWLLVKHCG
jgi:hypothetical protein